VTVTCDSFACDYQCSNEQPLRVFNGTGSLFALGNVVENSQCGTFHIKMWGGGGGGGCSAEGGGAGYVEGDLGELEGDEDLTIIVGAGGLANKHWSDRQGGVFVRLG
jgi:hypothetical protein